MPPAILRLAIPSPLRRTFDYLPPKESTPGQLKPGIRLRVPFGKRQVTGLLLEVSAAAQVDPGRLRRAYKVLDSEPLLPPHLLELIHWAARYYQHPVGDALFHCLPALLRQGEPAEYRSQHLWQLTPDGARALPDLPAQAFRQQQALQLLEEHPAGLPAEALRASGISAAILSTLATKGLAQQVDHRPPAAPAPPSLLHEAPLTLNAEQRAAVEAIRQHRGYGSFLLEGVTGSGKTEVYLQLIQHALEQKRQALVLVPEIGLTPQTVQRFRQRFQVPVAVLHSGLGDRERLDAWLQARSGEAAIVIGTRSALFTPLQAPGILIIDEEHDASFKQQEGFRYSARDLAVLRAHKEGIPIVLGSATPSLESLHNALGGRYHHLHLTQRAGSAASPAFRLLDIRQEPLEDGLSQPLLGQIGAHLKRGEQVLVFLNRRGFAPTLMCHRCGWIADCPQCDAHLTVHRAPPHLHCHHCDLQRPITLRCPECTSRELRPLGAGTERSEEALQRQFPTYPVIRVDRDSTRRKGSMTRIMQQVHSGAPCILLGTQMLAKGHHFPRVTLVAILDADTGLFSADFRGMEKMAQLILQVAGRAGRADHAGQVLMQTYHADHPRIHHLITQGYAPFARQELAQRQAAGLPPYSHLVLLRAEAVTPGHAEAFLQIARLIAEELGHPQVQLLGPMPSPMERRAGRHRAQLLLQSESRAPLQALVTRLALALEANRQARRVRWSLDVDPQDTY